MDINATLLGQIITFALLVWFVMKYVWPPITKAMSDRESKIAAGLAAAERGKAELENAENQVLTIIRGAKLEASHIVELANKRSQQILDEAKEQSRQEGMRIIEQARQEITREIAQAKESLRKQLAGLAVAGAEKIIQRKLDLSTETALLDEFVAEI